MMELMGTAIVMTEDMIRKKLNITNDNLDDIKSLSLPGSYNEKITHLGHSMVKFARLKELDLSRNSLLSLDGLETLKLLEKLNLYYNNISSLKELEKLRHNTLLTEIDLRLNPITKEENDYRLYLIYMLPSLKILDDRVIKDSERQMAVTFFDQTSLSAKSKHLNHESKYESYHNFGNLPNGTATRVRSVSNLLKRSIGLDEDASLVDISGLAVNKYESMSNLNKCFDSKNANDLIKKAQIEEYTQKDLKELGNIESQVLNANLILNSNLKGSEFNKNTRPKSSSMLNLKTINSEIQNKENGSNLSSGSQLLNSSKTKSVHFNEIPIYQDTKPEFSDETEAYFKYKSRGSFTPNPYFDDRQIESNDADNDLLPNEKFNQEELQNKSPLIILLDLVDRYWNGSKSLHKNFKFLNAANQLFNKSNYNQADTEANEQLKLLQEENKKLNQQIMQLKSNINIKNENEIQMRDFVLELDEVKKKYLASQEENKKLRKDIQERNEKLINEQTLESIENQNGTMKRDIEIMRIKLKQYEQLQQLTVMLQESHKSLVTTNEHLLNEISNQKYNPGKSLPAPPLTPQITNGSTSGSELSIPAIYSSQLPHHLYSSTSYDPLNQQHLAKNLIRKQFDQLSSNLGLLKNYK